MKNPAAYAAGSNACRVLLNSNEFVFVDQSASQMSCAQTRLQGRGISLGFMRPVRNQPAKRSKWVFRDPLAVELAPFAGLIRILRPGYDIPSVLSPATLRPASVPGRRA